MKIAVGASQTSSDIQSTSSSFKIQASGKAFKVLSSSLYNYKILAVVREISCNARDAHAMTKTLSKPFDVTLPSMENLHFIVRDYGPGLSPEDVMGMYTTYFQSTKMGDNDAIGGFGLGSKSPLSYATSFQVVSRHDGLKNTFLAFQNDNGEPDIYELSRQACSEPSGLEVIVPVNENDVRKFRMSAENVYRFFEVQPTITIGKRVVPHEEFFRYNLADKLTREVVYEDDRVAAFYSGVSGDSFSEISTSAVWAQMGDVIYPISISHAFDSSKADEHKMIRFFESGRYGKLLIRFGIGELDLNAGREGLSYDRTTIGRLKTVLSLIYGKLIQEANVEIAKASHYDVAVRESTKFHQFFGGEASHGMFTWQGKKVDSRSMSNFPTMENDHPEWKAFIDALVKLGGGDGMRYALMNNVRGEHTVRQLTGANINRLGPNLQKELHFVIVDEPLTGSRGSMKDRLVKHFTPSGLDNTKSVVVLKVSNIVVNGTKGSESASCVYRDVAKNLQAAKKLVESVTLVKNFSFLSEMPVAEVKKSTVAASTANGIRRVAEEVYCMNVGARGTNHLSRTVNFRTTDFDPDASTTKFYIKGNKSKVTFFDDERHTSRTTYNDYWDNTYNSSWSLLHSWAEHHAAGLKTKSFTLYYLNEKQIEAVKDNKNWVTVESHILTEFADLIRNVGKYCAFRMYKAGVHDSDTHKAMMENADYAARATEWNELAGQRSDTSFGSSNSFGGLVMSVMAEELKSQWATWSVLAGVDKTLYPTYDVWTKVFRSGTTRHFSEYIASISAVTAVGSFSSRSRNIAQCWKTELHGHWDSIENKPSVKTYLDQFFTGTN